MFVPFAFRSTGEGHDGLSIRDSEGSRSTHVLLYMLMCVVRAPAVPYGTALVNLSYPILSESRARVIRVNNSCDKGAAFLSCGNF